MLRHLSPYYFPPHSTDLPQRSKRSANFLRIELRLFPRGKVSAFGEFVVVDELWISFLRPTSRRCVDLVGKGAHSKRNGDDSLDVKKPFLRRLAGVPIQTRRRDCGSGQPVEGDVVEDVVNGESFRLSVDGPCQHCVAAREHYREVDDLLAWLRARRV
jgi:hypothetical protein